MASNWSTSGRLASFRLPLMAMSAQLLDHARGHVGPFPDDLFVVEKERVRGRSHGWGGGRGGAGDHRLELVPRQLQRERRGAVVGGGGEPVDGPDDLPHARR